MTMHSCRIATFSKLVWGWWIVLVVGCTNIVRESSRYMRHWVRSLIRLSNACIRWAWSVQRAWTVLVIWLIMRVTMWVIIIVRRDWRPIGSTDWRNGFFIPMIWGGHHSIFPNQIPFSFSFTLSFSLPILSIRRPSQRVNSSLKVIVAWSTGVPWCNSWCSLCLFLLVCFFPRGHTTAIFLVFRFLSRNHSFAWLWSLIFRLGCFVSCESSGFSVLWLRLTLFLFFKLCV